MLGQVLPDVFTASDEGAAKPADAKRGLDALLSRRPTCRASRPVFTSLRLLRDEGGKTVIDADAPRCRDALRRDRARRQRRPQGHRQVAGRTLRHAPYGWDFEVVRLLRRCPDARRQHPDDPQGRASIDLVTSVAAKDGLGNNNHFRVASFQPKKGVDFADVVAPASTTSQDTSARPSRNCAAVAGRRGDPRGDRRLPRRCRRSPHLLDVQSASPVGACSTTRSRR